MKTFKNQSSSLGNQAIQSLADLSDSIDELIQNVDQCFEEVDSSASGEIESLQRHFATQLYMALSKKQAGAANHSQRVALACSAWAKRLEFPESQLASFEIAALLHDIGKIGVPGEILAKPGSLSQQERDVLEAHRKNGLLILQNCRYSKEIIEAVLFSPTWFDGARNRLDRQGKEIPQFARMLSIVDAFDSMTTDQVYRRALSIERAVTELFEHSGTQFDHELVTSFCRLVAPDWSQLTQESSESWLGQLRQQVAEEGSSPSEFEQNPVAAKVDSSLDFHRVLSYEMRDAAFFIDSLGRVTFWNRAAERLTGIAADGIIEKEWDPSLINMRLEHEETPIGQPDCPIYRSIRVLQRISSQFLMTSRRGDEFLVSFSATPIIEPNRGTSIGAVVTLVDLSSTVSLEERVEELNTRVTRDPLTNVANRGEFDRVLDLFVEEHVNQNTTCSLVMCDIDFFKKVNDDFSHQAGDEALKSFATLLGRHAGRGDLVARYGGEEFALLLANCNNAEATRRSEEIRKSLQGTPQPELGGKCLTASFGVTEVQSGDTPDTMLRRADRALMRAKQNGRNQVVQLGTGISEGSTGETLQTPKSTGLFGWLNSGKSDTDFQAILVSSVPMDIVVMKLQGFVADHDSQIVSVEEDRITLRIDGRADAFMRRRADRSIPFSVVMEFDKLEEGANTNQTRIGIVATPIRSRDRRRSDLVDRFQLILSSLMAYLMASREDSVSPLPPGNREIAATESGREAETTE